MGCPKRLAPAYFTEDVMETSNLHHLAGYDYHLGTYPTDEGSHRGLILLMAYRGAQLCPPVKIPTPTSFHTDRAAKIEASALAYQLIHTGAVKDLVPHDWAPK